MSVNAITYVPDLGLAAGFAIFGFRVSARGQWRCRVVQRGFANTLGEDASDVLERMVHFARELGFSGNRKVTLGMPGCIRATSDELSFLAALNAAQAGNAELCKNHLDWIFGGAAPSTSVLNIMSVAKSFQKNGLSIEPLEKQERPAARQVDLATVEVAGHA